MVDILLITASIAGILLIAILVWDIFNEHGYSDNPEDDEPWRK